ncbi:hypothetical protein AABM38_20225 [Heyndrickxia sp. MSNUG]|uniref:hypothetical protein n=1 Tax=Heyndrickxia sp. MSNUG TaxID=3136677 RepID=UPI003C2CDF3C
MVRKIVICVGIFLSLFTGFFILDNREDKELSKQGTGAEPGVLRIQQTDMDEVETAKTYIPFGSREYVRIIPK